MDQTQPIDFYFLLFAGSAGMFLLACAFIFLFLLFHKRNVKAREERFTLEKAYQEQLIFSNLQTLEEERERYARDLHDEIGVNLSTVSMRIKGLSRINDKEEQTRGFDEISGVIEHSINSTRRIAHNLIPPGIEKFGLHHILSEQVSSIAKGTSIKIHVECDESIVRPGHASELMVYRILQELLNNTLKHAEASEVKICFEHTGDLYIVSYYDNGKGFTLNIKEGLGIGLRNLESRAKMIGAECHFETSEGKGMTAVIRLPLRQPIKEPHTPSG